MQTVPMNYTARTSTSSTHTPTLRARDELGRIPATLAVDLPSGAGFRVDWPGECPVVHLEENPRDDAMRGAALVVVARRLEDALAEVRSLGERAAREAFNEARRDGVWFRRFSEANGNDLSELGTLTDAELFLGVADCRRGRIEAAMIGRCARSALRTFGFLEGFAGGALGVHAWMAHHLRADGLVVR